MIARLKNLRRELYRRHAMLTIIGTGLLIATVFFPLLMVVDSRTLLGINIWLKPMKFVLAFGIYFLTLAWFLGDLPHSTRTKKWISRGNVFGLSLELPALLIQPIRGVSSHFNTTTLFDAGLYGMMGFGVLIQMLLLVALTVMYFDSRINLDRAYLHSVRSGLLIFLAGILPGIVMLVLRAHTVGAADGGPGLPLVNWSVQAGDLRASHFVGMHAMQLLPLVGLIAVRWIRNPERRVTVVAVATTAYAALFVFVFSLALLGQPLPFVSLFA